jgi:hypothetical protein
MKNIIIPALLLLIVISFESCQLHSNEPHETEPYASGSVTGHSNFPLQNIIATVNGQSTFTGEAGGFGFRNLPEVFDIYIKDHLRYYDILYKDITKGNFYITLPLPTNHATYEYTVDVQCPSLPAGTKGKLFLLTGTGILCAQNYDSSTTMVYRIPTNMYPSGNVILLTYTTDAEGSINDYTNYAKSDVVTPEPGITKTVTISQSQLLPVAEVPVNISLTPPAGSTYIKSDLIFNFTKHVKTNISISSQSMKSYTTNTFTVILPSKFSIPTDFIPALCISTNGTNGNSEEMKLIPYQTNAYFNLKDAPYITAPENEATNIDSNTVFSHTKLSNSGVVIFTLIDSAANRSYNLCTSSDNITLKTLSPMVTLQPNKRYAYTLTQVGTNNQNIVEYLSNGNQMPYFSGTTPKRYFTTKP